MNRLLAIKDYLWAALVVMLVVFGVTQYVSKASVERSFAEYKVEVAQATTNAEKSARAREQALQTRIDKVSHESNKKQGELAARIARTDRTAASLRDEIARLNARPAPTNPEAAGFADEATAARQLLGSCSDEYRGVAAQADGLRDQIVGLHAYIKEILKE